VRHPLGLGSEGLRVQLRGAGIDQVAHQRDRVGQHQRAAGGPARVLTAGQQRELRRRLALAAAVPAEGVTAQQRAQRDSLGLVGVPGRQGQGDRGGARRDRADRGAGRPAQRLAGEGGRAVDGAEADRGDQRRWQLARRRDLRDFLRLAGRAECGERTGEAPAEGRVHLLGAGGRLRTAGPLDNTDDNGVGGGIAGGFLTGTQRGCHDPSLVPDRWFRLRSAAAAQSAETTVTLCT